MSKVKFDPAQTRFFRLLASKFNFLYPWLDLELKQAGLDYKKEEWLSKCLFNSFLFFFFILILSIFMSMLLKFNLFLALLISLVLSSFYYFTLLNLPKVRARNRVRDIERNLLPALQEMLTQLRSGIPLFNILVNLSESGYGELSKELRQVVREIEAGTKQEIALEKLCERTPSLQFRRAIWQLINAMRAGSNVTSVIEQSIRELSAKQLNEINQYGAHLNPLAMFYMLVAVILPALAITFLVVLSSLIPFSSAAIKGMLIGFAFVLIFLQLLFICLLYTSPSPRD